MKKLLKLTGITIALITVGAVTRARVKNINSEIIKLEAKVSEISGKINR